MHNFTKSVVISGGSKLVARLIAVIFFFSGVSALIYQVAWQRLLTVYYGVGPVSIVLVVTVYMIGLGFGALFGGFLSERLRRLVLLYCLVELVIGLFGIISPGFLDLLGRHTAGGSYELTFIASFGFLFVPTFLMGMTLPVLTKLLSRAIDDFFGAVSFLYFANTIGAAFGALLASYVIISFFGLLSAVYFAAAINLSIAAAILLILRFARGTMPARESQGLTESSPGLGVLAYPIAVITGFLAIGYEITWFRIIGQLTKDSPYAFSSVLAVYLTGVAVGSYGISRLLRGNRSINRRSLFFALQFLIGVAVALSVLVYYYLTSGSAFGSLSRASFLLDVHPAWDAGQGSGFSLLSIFLMFDVFIWSALFVLIPTVLMGASFPLISFLAPRSGEQEGKTVGRIYFFTIVGNALGGLLTGLFIIPRLGTELTLELFCAIGLAFGLGAGKLREGHTATWRARALVVGAIAAAGAVVFPRQGQFYEMLYTTLAFPRGEFLYNEGVDGVVVSYLPGNELHTFINGQAHGGRFCAACRLGDWRT